MRTFSFRHAERLAELYNPNLYEQIAKDHSENRAREKEFEKMREEMFDRFWCNDYLLHSKRDEMCKRIRQCFLAFSSLEIQDVYITHYNAYRVARSKVEAQMEKEKC